MDHPWHHSYGTTGHHPTIRSTVRLNPFIQPFYNHRPLLRRSTCDMHGVVLGSYTLSTIFTDLHILHFNATFLKGITPWAASGATLRTMMEDNDGDHRGPLLPRHEPSTWQSLTWASATSWDEDADFDHALRTSAVSGRAPARLRPRPAARPKKESWARKKEYRA